MHHVTVRACSADRGPFHYSYSTRENTTNHIFMLYLARESTPHIQPPSSQTQIKIHSTHLKIKVIFFQRFGLMHPIYASSIGLCTRNLYVNNINEVRCHCFSLQDYWPREIILDCSVLRFMCASRAVICVWTCNAFLIDI